MADPIDGLAITLRRLVRAPTFSLGVIATLALGVGANAAVFSVVSGVLVEPLSYPEAERIVFVQEHNDGIDMPPGWSTVPNYLDWRERAVSFDALALFRGRSVSITTDVIPEYAYGALVSSEFFEVFATDPLLGRGFTPDEARLRAERVVVLGHALWVRGFGGDEGILGRDVSIDGRMHTVVGVMPPGFEAHGDWVGTAVQLWRPFVITDEVLGQGRSFHVAGRLAAGVSLEAARAEMSALQESLVRLRPEENTDWHVRLERYRDMIVGDVAPALWLLLATTAVVLVVACTNVAGLALNRVFDRRGEIATRLALGAQPRSVVGLVLAESALLAVMGGAAGVFLARGLLSVLRRVEPGRIPRLAVVEIDGRVLLLSLGVVVLSALAFGGAAAVAAARCTPGGALREQRSRGGVHAGLGRNLLVIAQLALSFALLLTSGLLVRSFAGLRSTDLGFRPEGVTAATVALSWDRVSSLADRTRFTTEVLETLRALPGVESAGMINSLPLSGSDATQQVEIEGGVESGRAPALAVRGVSPGYLETLGIPLLAGRVFAAADVEEPRVVLVNRAMSERSWPGADAIGRRLRGAGDEAWVTVVGVVGDVRHYGPDVPVRPELYVPYSAEFLTSKTFVVRGGGSGEALGDRLREAIAAVDPEQPVREVRSMEDWAAEATAGLRFQALTMSLGAGLATSLAAIGLFGVLAGLVRSRSSELAIRMALGAPRGSVLSLVLARAGRLVFPGLIAGATLALLADGALQGFLLGVSVHDPAVIAASTLLFVLVGCAAALVPARRATSLDPARVLREE